MKCGSQLAPHDVLDIQIMSPPDLIFFGTKQQLIDDNSTDFHERENFVENAEAPKTQGIDDRESWLSGTEQSLS
jgi:hypothetical protein